MSPRAFTGSAGVSGEELKSYIIYAKEDEIEKKIPTDIWNEIKNSH